MSKTNNENLLDFPTDVSVCRWIFFCISHHDYVSCKIPNPWTSQNRCFSWKLLSYNHRWYERKKEASWLERPSSRVLQYTEANHCYHASYADYRLTSSCQALPLLAPAAMQCQVLNSSITWCEQQLRWRCYMFLFVVELPWLQREADKKSIFIWQLLISEAEATSSVWRFISTDELNA